MHCLFLCRKKSKSFFINRTKNDKKYHAPYVIYVNNMKNNSSDNRFSRRCRKGLPSEYVSTSSRFRSDKNATVLSSKIPH